MDVHLTGARASQPTYQRLWRLLPVLALTVIATAAAEPRVTSLRTTESGIELDLADAGDAKFRIDGRPVTGNRIDTDSARTRWRLEALPSAPQRLTIDLASGESLALSLAADDSAAGRYNDWNIYHVMLSFFANGSRDNDKYGMRKWIHRNYAGGDLQGVLARADHIAGLGMNAVWLSPVFASESSHGYDVTNYFEIGQGFAIPRDPDASRELFDSVVAALHTRGLRVILDLPLDYGSGAYDRRRGDPNRRRPKSTGPRQEAEKMWESWGTDFRYWNFDDSGTREFLRDVARYWVEDGGVDGLRLDYVRGVPHDFWAELYADLKRVRPGTFVFGEAWQDASSVSANALDIATYYAPVEGIGPQFDGLLEYPLQIVMTDVFATGAAASLLEHWMQRTTFLYGSDGRPVHFLDNHDVSRFLAWTTTNGHDRLVAAVAFMASLSSPLVLYYGTETGLTGGSAQPGFVDDGRVAMPWATLDQALVDRIAEVMSARKVSPAITRGARWPLHSDDDTLVMLKSHPAGDVLVGVNLSDQARTVVLGQLGAARSVALLGESLPQMNGDGAWRWTLPPISTTWVQLVEQDRD